MTVLAIVSSPLLSSSPSNVVCPVFSVNSSAKINFIRVSPPPPPGWCHPGRSVPLPSDATDTHRVIAPVTIAVIKINVTQSNRIARRHRWRHLTLSTGSGGDSRLCFVLVHLPLQKSSDDRVARGVDDRIEAGVDETQ